MLGLLLQTPAPTADLVAVKRRVQAAIPFLETVDQVWWIDDTRVVAYISGVRQGRYLDCGKPVDLFLYGDYSYVGLWKLNTLSPKLLCRSSTIDSEPAKRDKPIFQRNGNFAVFGSARVGADHYSTYAAALDLTKNLVRTLYDDSGILSGIHIKNNVANVTLRVSGTRGREKWSGVREMSFKLK
jgi:hypothetical protein